MSQMCHVCDANTPMVYSVFKMTADRLFRFEDAQLEVFLKPSLFTKTRLHDAAFSTR